MRPLDTRSGVVSLKCAGAPFAFPCTFAACALTTETVPTISNANAIDARRYVRAIDIVSPLLSVWMKIPLSPYRENDSRDHETHEVVSGIDKPELLRLS